MATLLLNCTHCVKSESRVPLILLLSVTCRSLAVTVSSQLWSSINTAAAEAFMFRALFPRFALLCIHWINFTLIESSPDLSAFKLYWCVRWCEPAGALFNFSVLHLSPICMCVRMWVCVCVVISKGSGNQGNLETAVTSAHQQWLRWSNNGSKLRLLEAFCNSLFCCGLKMETKAINRM